MEPFLGGLSVFFWWLVRSTAQVSVLVCLVLVLRAAFGGRLPARWHHGLWLVVVVRMIMPWAPQSRLSMFNLIPVSYRSGVADFEWATTEAEDSSTAVAVPPGPGDYTSIKGVITPERSPKVPTRSRTDVSPHRPDVAQREPFFDRLSNRRAVLLAVGRSLPVIWLAGVAVLGCYVCIANVSLWRIVKRERLLTEQKILNLLEDCKEQIGVRTVLGVVVSARVRSPVLFGFLRPRLVLPVGTVEALSLEELRYVFLHELAHVKRNDILLGWVTSVLSVLHWFNPLVWYAFYRMRADREAACDALALSRMNAEEPPAYGRTIVTLLERFSRVQYVPGVVGVLESKVQLERRIVMIAKFKKGSQRLTLPAALAVLVLACVSLTDARSVSGGASSAEEPGPPGWVVSDKPDGSSGTALQFDGASNFVRVPGGESLDIRGSLTLSAWVKNDGDVDGQIIWRGDAQGGHDPYELHITQRKMEFRIDAGSDTNQTYGTYVVQSRRPVDDAWHFWTGVYDKEASKIHLYKDGELENTTYIDVAIEYDTSSMWNMLGAVDRGTWQHFKGVIDDARIWNVARTQEQIKRDMRRSLSGNEAGLVAYWKFNEGEGDVAADSSPNRNDGKLGVSERPPAAVRTVEPPAVTNLGGPQWVESTFADEKEGYALQFDGENDFVMVASSESLDLRSSLTLSAWVLSDGDDDGQIVWRGDTQGGHDPYELHVTERKMEFRIDAGSDSGTYAEYKVQSRRPVDEAWHFWTGVYDKKAGKIHLYKDGQLENSSHIGDEIGYSTFSMWNMIGAVDRGTWQHFKGVIDEVRIWNMARTQEQITKDMDRSLRGNEEGLVGYWRFNEGEGDTAADSSPNHNDGMLGEAPRRTPTRRRINGSACAGARTRQS